jgi:hypothetical protein
MQNTSVFFWARMASTATAVLPIWRSPMISSRCPAHGGHGIDRLEAGVAGFVHRFSGDDTGEPPSQRGFRAFDGAFAVDGLTHAGDHAAEHRSPTGTWAILPVRLTMSPSLIPVSSPMMAIPTLSSSRLSTSRECRRGTPPVRVPWLFPGRRRGQYRHRPTRTTPVSLSSICLS